MRPLKYSIVILLLITTAGVFAAATEPDPVAPEKSGVADPAEADVKASPPAGLGELEVNKAEMEDGMTQGEPTVDVERTRVESPLMTAIDAVMQDSRDRITVLRADFEKQGDPEAALAIQRQIEDLKVETELNILRLQADHARARGDEELAREIDESIIFMTTPRPKVAPVDRPAPDAGRR